MLLAHAKTGDYHRKSKPPRFFSPIVPKTFSATRFPGIFTQRVYNELGVDSCVENEVQQVEKTVVSWQTRVWWCGIRRPRA